MTVHPLTLRPAKSALLHRSSSSRLPVLRCRYLGLQQPHHPQHHHYDHLSPSTTMQFVPPPGPRHHLHKPSSLLGNLRQSYVRRSPSSDADEPSGPGNEMQQPYLQQQQHHAATTSSPPRVPICFTFSDSEEEDIISVSSDASSGVDSPGVVAPPRRRRCRRVQFASSVSVREIPNRHAYPADIKLALWNSRKQIRRAASRNAFEYAWEGHNWRTAVEEEYFLPLHGGRQWIHPAHLPSWQKHNQFQCHSVNQCPQQPEHAQQPPLQQSQPRQKHFPSSPSLPHYAPPFSVSPPPTEDIAQY